MGLRLVAVLVGNTLLRIASSAGGALLSFYLAYLATNGRPIGAGVVGALGLVANAAELLIAVPMGVAADRSSPRLVMAASALIGAVASQLYGLSELVPIFFLARALQDFAVAAGGPPLLAHLALVTNANQRSRGRVMGLYELSLLTGLALGGVVGGTLWSTVGTLGFSLLALLYLVIGVLFFWGAYEAPGLARPAREHPLEGLRQALGDPMLRRLALPWLAMNGIIGMWLTHIVFQLSGPRAAGQYLVGRFNANQVGFILLGFAVVFALGVLAWSYALAYVPRLLALRTGMVAMLVTCLWLYLLNGSEGWPAALRWLVVGLAAVSIAVESGFTPAALAMLADIAGRSTGRGAAMGIYTLLLGVGSGIGAVVGALLARPLAFNGLLLGTILLLVLAFASLQFLPQEGV